VSEAQVVVIGSGAGGAAFTWAMASSGVRVQVLEAGPSYDPSTDYRLSSPSWEQTRFPAKIGTRGRQTHSPLQSLDTAWGKLRSWNHLFGKMVRSERRVFDSYHHVIGVGGTTLHYTGESHRLHPAAMSMHSRFGVAADWPFDYDELEPYYLKAERLIGVAGPAENGVRTRSAAYPLPAHPLSYASQKLGAGCRQLGLSWTPNPVASLSRAYDGRPPCNYCGQCTRGCPRFDKRTADITFMAQGPGDRKLYAQYRQPGCAPGNRRK
jgi:choline dehydrogenase-like flavoprotein